MDPEECIFCKIVKNEIATKKVYEDEATIAFLDINPANYGHVLVIPKKHVEDIYKADEPTVIAVAKTVKKIASLLKDKLNTEGVNVIQNNGKLAGQIVAHYHVHVIPRYKDDKVVINYERKQPDEAKMDEIVSKLKTTGKPENTDEEMDLGF